MNTQDQATVEIRQAAVNTFVDLHKNVISCVSVFPDLLRALETAPGLLPETQERFHLLRQTFEERRA